jgi:hypothetical protein
LAGGSLIPTPEAAGSTLLESLTLACSSLSVLGFPLHTRQWIVSGLLVEGLRPLLLLLVTLWTRLLGRWSVGCSGPLLLVTLGARLLGGVGCSGIVC